MTQHFTLNTVSATFYCGKCGKPTSHRIDKGRKGPCLECIARLEKRHFESFKRCAGCFLLGCPCAGPGHCGCACHAADVEKQQELFA